MKKKLILVISVLWLFVGILVGCSGKTDGELGEDNQAPNVEGQTLKEESKTKDQKNGEENLKEKPENNGDEQESKETSSLSLSIVFGE